MCKNQSFFLLSGESEFVIVLDSSPCRVPRFGGTNFGSRDLWSRNSIYERGRERFFTIQFSCSSRAREAKVSSFTKNRNHGLQPQEISSAANNHMPDTKNKSHSFSPTLILRTVALTLCFFANPTINAYCCKWHRLWPSKFRFMFLSCSQSGLEKRRKHPRSPTPQV